jgi:glutamate racemase
MAKIGVFDSGIGGLSVAKAIERAMPDSVVVYVNDHEHMPYGDKTQQQVLALVTPILQGLVAQGCDAIVIACNTVTTNHIEQLRSIITVPLIGIEPMVKPAAEQTKTGVICVCATPATLASKRYAWLKSTYAKGVQILEPDCSTWAYMIEHNQINDDLLREQINDVCDKGADVIVLGCTHYHWIEDVIQSIANERAVVVQPEQPVISQLQRVLER